jgi:hypothetical protein
VDTTGGVNRVTIHANESDVAVFINGQEVLRTTDNDVRTGNMDLGLLAQGQSLPTINFENIVITTPAHP